MTFDRKFEVIFFFQRDLILLNFIINYEWLTFFTLGNEIKMLTINFHLPVKNAQKLLVGHFFYNQNFQN